MKVSVHFLGARSDVAELLPAFDLVVLPSHPVVETLPLSVMEAMAAGRPVVATRVGALDELIEDGITGWLVPPRDPEALADRLAACLADPGAMTQVGLNRYRIDGRGHVATSRRSDAGIAIIVRSIRP
ncbi:MAG: hypothetical protein FD129_3125 [bacterium]|nr:MAG: hypothetical protein FD129_3125 [bacterium]